VADPRERISAYHDMPYALFRYEPDEEFDLRRQVTLLETGLLKGKASQTHLAGGVAWTRRCARSGHSKTGFPAEREQGTVYN